VVTATNITYANYGISFEYPDTLTPVELGYAGDVSTNMNNGMVKLTGSGDNITISWLKTNHVQPNIPLLYESLRAVLQKDPKISNLKFYEINTYSSTICGNAAFIGRASYYDNVLNLQVNEGYLIWNHPSQDRLYMMDIVSSEDYYSSILGNLERYQESFKCADS